MKKLTIVTAIALSLGTAFSASAELSLLGQSVDAVPSNAELKPAISQTFTIDDLSYTVSQQKTTGELLYSISMSADYSDVKHGVLRCRTLVGDLVEAFGEQGQLVSGDIQNITVNDSDLGVSIDNVAKANVFVFEDDSTSVLRIEDACQTTGGVSMLLSTKTEVDVPRTYSDTSVLNIAVNGFPISVGDPIEQEPPVEGSPIKVVGGW